MENVGVKGLTNLKSDIAAIKELRQIEKDVQPDVIHLHSSVAGGLGRLAYKGKNNTVVYTPHGYAHILMGPGKKSKIYKFAEKVLGNKALTLTCCESEDEEAKKFSRRTAYVETGVNLADLSASLDGIEPVKMISLRCLPWEELAFRNSHSFLTKLRNWFQRRNLFGLVTVNLKMN